MRAPTFPSRWTRRQRVRRSIARAWRARRQRRLPTLGPVGPAVHAAGCGGSVPAARGGSTGGRRGTADASRPAFVEFPPLTLALPTDFARTECTIELERASGTRLRVRLQGLSAADIAALGHWFWSAGR